MKRRRKKMKAGEEIGNQRKKNGEENGERQKAAIENLSKEKPAAKNGKIITDGAKISKRKSGVMKS